MRNVGSGAMSDTAEFEIDPYFEQAPVDWALDPLEDRSGGMLAIQRVALVRIACVNDTDGRPTPEGHSVLLMLFATHTREDAAEDVGLDWIIANRTVAGHSERIAAAEQIERRERVAARMAHRFATDTIGNDSAVKLIGLRITREIPVRSTLWTMTWPDGDCLARDRFYLWLLERIDRWDNWSEMVTQKGARALTEHFLKLAFCDRDLSSSE